MRKIFPLKSASSASSNHHNGQQQQSAWSGLAATPFPKEGPRPKAVGVSSRYAPELSKKITTARTKKGDASTSDDMNSPNPKSGNTKREHWCPACPAAESGVRCATPPSGDENIEGKEGEQGVIVSSSSNNLPSGASQSRRSIHGDSDGVADEQSSNLDEHLKGNVCGTMTGGDIYPASVDKYPSKRSGLGAVENVMHERVANKPGIKPKTAAAATVFPPLPDATAQDDAPRSTSAPKGRAISRSGPPDGPRVHSMRIARVPDRVFDAAVGPHQSGYLPRLASDLSSATDNGTPRASRAAAAERQRQMNLPLVKTHSRAQSFTEGVNGGKPPINSPSFSRPKPTDSPRVAKKESGTPVPFGVSATEPTTVEKGGPLNKYSGARVVAERLAKAFRGTSKSKEGRALADTNRKTTLGESRRMSLEQQQSSDGSYDGSCSETSSLQASADEKMLMMNALPLVRAEDVHSPRSQKEKVISSDDEHTLTWQEFVSGGRTPSRGLSNDDKPIPEKSADLGPQQVPKSLGPNSESRRWGSSAHEGSKNSVSRQQHTSSQQEEKEREILKAWLEGLKKQSEGMNDDLEMKARMAEQRLSMLNGEQSLYDDQLEFLHELQMKDDNGKGSLAAGINIMQQRIRRMHEEKKRLALEVASEVKRRITERAAAKEVLVMMKREMEACVRVMEKEKMGIQSGLQRELERRERDWVSKLEAGTTQEKSLRDRIRWLEEEKVGLQNDLAGAELKESSFRQKVKEFELQMEGHKKRVEGAEQTILDLRQSLVSCCQQARQAESELDAARKTNAEKEIGSQDLAKQVKRLQERISGYESKVDGSHQGLKNGSKLSSDLNGWNSESMKKELARMRVIEKSLREELEISKKEISSLQNENRVSAEKMGNAELDSGKGRKSNQELQTELTNLHLRTVQLQDENSVVSLDLQQAIEERDSGREALKTLEAKLSDVEGADKVLQDDIGREKSKTQEKEREIHRLERRVDGLLKNNQMLQGILAMREKAAVISDEEAKEKERAISEAHQLEAEMRESLQVSARQLSFMSDRAELMNEKLQEREAQLTTLKIESGKKDETIRSLEHSLGDLAKSVDAQNRRIMHLTSKNGELSRHLQARGKEVEDLHLKIVEDSQTRIDCSQEVDQLSVQTRDIKQELEAQNLLCKLLRDKLSQREDDLSKRCDEVTGLVRGRDWLQDELKRTQSSLAEASEQFASLERTVRQNEELLSSLMTEKDVHIRDLAKLKEILTRVEQERDEIQEEAEEIGREALRMSAEVEVLRRRVAQLEEDVMVKEGQISILRSSGYGGSQ